MLSHISTGLYQAKKRKSNELIWIKFAGIGTGGQVSIRLKCEGFSLHIFGK